MTTKMRVTVTLMTLQLTVRVTTDEEDEEMAGGGPAGTGNLVGELRHRNELGQAALQAKAVFFLISDDAACSRLAVTATHTKAMARVRNLKMQTFPVSSTHSGVVETCFILPVRTLSCGESLINRLHLLSQARSSCFMGPDLMMTTRRATCGTQADVLHFVTEVLTSELSRILNLLPRNRINKILSARPTPIYTKQPRARTSLYLRVCAENMRFMRGELGLLPRGPLTLGLTKSSLAWPGSSARSFAAGNGGASGSRLACWVELLVRRTGRLSRTLDSELGLCQISVVLVQ